MVDEGCRFFIADKNTSILITGHERTDRGTGIKFPDRMGFAVRRLLNRVKLTGSDFGRDFYEKGFKSR